MRNAASLIVTACLIACSSGGGGGTGGGTASTGGGSSGGGDATGGGSTGGGSATGGGTGTGGGSIAPGPFTSQGTSTYETQTSVASDGQGGVVAVWISFFANNTSSIGYAVSHDSGATFTAPQQLQSPGGRLASNPVVVADSQRRFWVAWLGFRASSPYDEHVYVAKLGAGDAFGTPAPASDDGTSTSLDLDKPSLAVDATDRLLVTYADFTGTPSLQLAVSTDGTAFTKSTIVNDQTFGNLAYLCLDTAAGMNAPLYLVHLSANATITLRVSTNRGAHWAASAVAVPATSVVFQDPTCVVHGSDVWISYGSGTAVFSPGTDSPADAVQLVHTGNGGAAFDAPVVVSNGVATTKYLFPRIARTGTGKLLLTYYQASAAGGAAEQKIASSTNGTAFTIASVAQTGTLTLDRTLANWLGGYTGLTVLGTQALVTHTENANTRAHIAFTKVTPP